MCIVGKSMPNNKRRIFFSSRGALLAPLFFGLVSTPIWATFDVMDEDTEGYYGNAQIRPFKDAVDNTDDLSAKDRAFLNSVEETRVTERWYARILVGQPQVKLKSISNKSSPPNDVYQVAYPEATDTLYQFSFAGGHIWEHWGLEIELYFPKTLNYFANPFLAGRTESASAKIKQAALLFNAQYVIPRWFSFYPRKLQVHLDAGFGPALTTTNMSTVDATGVQTDSSSVRTVNAAGMLGVGARYQIVPSLLVDLDYRFYDLGKSNFGPLNIGPGNTPPCPTNSPNCQLQNMKFQSTQIRSSGLFVGATYQV